MWRQHLTKEYKFSKMLLQKFEYSKVDLSIATKESLSTERPFPFQCPDIYLFLAISKCAVAWISTFLLSSYIYKDRELKVIYNMDHWFFKANEY